MSIPLSDDQVLRLRLRSQRLAPLRDSAAEAAQVVRDLCGVQAQDVSAAALAVRARCAALVAADVERALAQERSIVRTWCMRGTLHFVAVEDMGWLLGLLGPIFIRAGRGRRAELGLDDETAARAIRALRDVLAQSGPLARDQIVERLGARGVHLAGQARPHLLSLAALQGIICIGPARGREPTYVLISDWVDPGPALPPEQALAELAARYLSAYAPAAPEDFAAWSGLPLTQARAGWSQIMGTLVEIEDPGSDLRGFGRPRRSPPLWMLRTHTSWLEESAAPTPILRLLPAYDTYLLGYRSRDRIVAPEHAKRVFPGGGLLRPALLLDGRVKGAWQIKRRRGGIDVIVETFDDSIPDVLRELEAEVQNLARFMGATATLHVTAPG